MARKTTSRRHDASNDSDMGKAVSDSAQKIWLAGLGAYERAKTEGPKMFDMLVEQGKSLGGKAREAADQALKTVRDASSEAGSRFDKLEQVFEDRVSKSLNRLGVLTRGEVADLSRQVGELSDEVRALMRQSAAGTGAGGARRGGSSKRRAAAKAGATKRKVKRRATRG
jgi:poly(hydroxyalkanoate) granule-associated protein